jgi:hypothetical protein
MYIDNQLVMNLNLPYVLRELNTAVSFLFYAKRSILVRLNSCGNYGVFS